jgi:hypothetical protein
MKHTNIVDPCQDFWESVQGVHANVQHIERLKRQMDIDVRNMEAKDGEVDQDAYSSRILRAIDLRLIDPADAREFSSESLESVKAAYDFVKGNIRQIQTIAEDPYGHEKLIDKTSMRDEGKKRRYFCDLTS